jgi:hypothetical protein
LVGLYVFARACWDGRRMTSADDPYVVRPPAPLGLFCTACIVLGFGSGLMHAASILLGHKLDVFGMFITLSLLVALHFLRWVFSVMVAGRRCPTWPVLGVVPVAGRYLLAFHGRAFPVSSNNTVAMLCTLVMLGKGLDKLRRGWSVQYRWPLLALVALILACYIRVLDIAGRFSTTDFWFQGHAIWHLLGAASLGFMALYCRSERPRQLNGT